MRALFMDFKEDKATWNNNSEFMYGRSLLICPVLHPLYTKEQVDWSENPYPEVDWTAEKSYDVYLPDGARWYDYRTQKCYEGGQTITTSTPLAYAPIFVKAGSILPLGPDVQYTNEKPWDNLDILVYPGADAEFTLYEDEGDNYNYEKGMYSTITFRWNDKAGTLTIAKRQGAYSGMIATRQFNVKVVGGSEKKVIYNGKQQTISIN
jgi:alpha-D-xyloside xylohydrolase